MNTIPLSCCHVCGDIWVSNVYRGHALGYRTAICEMRSERVFGAGLGELHQPDYGFIVDTAYPVVEPEPGSISQTQARALVDAIPEHEAERYWALAKLFAAADNSQE